MKYLSVVLLVLSGCAGRSYRPQQHVVTVVRANEHEYECFASHYNAKIDAFYWGRFYIVSDNHADAEGLATQMMSGKGFLQCYPVEEQ